MMMISITIHYRETIERLKASLVGLICHTHQHYHRQWLYTVVKFQGYQHEQGIDGCGRKDFEKRKVINQLENVTINDVLPLKAARRDAIANYDTRHRCRRSNYILPGFFFLSFFLFSPLNLRARWLVFPVWVIVWWLLWIFEFNNVM